MILAIEANEDKSVPHDLRNDIKKLQKDLEVIKQGLDEIAAQSQLLKVLFKMTNKAKIEHYTVLLRSSLEQWHVSSDISNRMVLNHMANEVSALQKSLSNLLRPAHSAKRAWTRHMPPKPMIFCGRDDFVDDIARILIDATGLRPPRICIHGPGGMGKTSAAIAATEHPDVQNKFREENRFWVPCVSATSPDMLLHILYSNFRISRDTGDYLSDIITELQSSAAPRLLLLDNFETPWDPVEGTKENVEDVLRSLSAVSQLSILVTMRTNVPPSEQIDWISKPLGSIDAETSREVFCAIHSDAKGKPKLEDLLVDLGHMPLAITLVATLGKRSKVSPSTLLEDWRKCGPGMLSSDESIEDSISRSIGLSMNSKTIVKNASARALLATLAILPAGTTYSHLDRWAPELGNKKTAATSALMNVALRILISILRLPVIQSYMQRGDHIPSTVRNTVRDACFKFVLDHKSSPGDVKFKSDLKTLSSEESNIQSILLEMTRDVDNVVFMPDTEKVLEVLLAFSWYQNWTKPRTEIIEHTPKLAQKAQLDKYVAECLFCLASTLFKLDRYDEACKNYIEARDGFRKLSNAVRASECSFELVELYQYMSRKSDAKRALKSVSKKTIATNGYVKARGRLAQGQFCWYTRKYNKALKHLTVAKKAFGDIKRPVDTALCLYEISMVLGKLHKWKEAWDAVDQSLKLFETFGPDHRFLRALMRETSILLKMKAPPEELLPKLERTFQKAQELGGPLGIAHALELFGEFYTKQLNAPFAIEYYKAAEEQYQTIAFVVLTKEVSRCQHNAKVLEERGLLVDGCSHWQDLVFLSDVVN